MRRREVELSLVLVGVALLAWWSRPPTPQDEMFRHLAEGSARYNWGYYTEALDELNWVIDRVPNCHEAYYRRARTYLAMGWTKEALDDYRHALRRGFDAHRLSGELSDMQFTGARGNQLCDLVLEAYQKDPTCARNLGWVYAHARRWEEARKYLEVAGQQGEDVVDELSYVERKGEIGPSYAERWRNAIVEQGQSMLMSSPLGGAH